MYTEEWNRTNRLTLSMEQYQKIVGRRFLDNTELESTRGQSRRPLGSSGRMSRNETDVVEYCDVSLKFLFLELATLKLKKIIHNIEQVPPQIQEGNL